MPNVDSLNIQISATAQKANSSLDVLIGKLGVLSSSLRTVQSSNLSGLADGVNKLSTSMQTMKNVGTADFTRLAKGIQKIGGLDATMIGNAASAMNQLGQSLQSVTNTNLSGGATQITEVAGAIKQLGYKSSTQAIANIPKLAVAMRELMVELSKAPVVNRNVIDMTNALAKLARTGSSSGKAFTSLTKSMNLFSSSTGKAKSSSFSLASAIGKVYATYWMLFRALSKVREAIDISSQLTEVQNVVNTTFGDYRNLIEEFSKTSIVDYGMSELTAKKVSSTFQAMGTAMGFTQGKMAGMSVELTKLAADMASFYNLDQEDVAEDLQSVFTGQTRPLRQYGLDLTEATLKEYAMKKGLDANLSSMSQAEKTLLRYQYVIENTGAAHDDFKDTFYSWANQTRVLAENFKALASIIGGTFINALKPMVIALNQAMGALTSFAKTVSNSLGKIFGWQYEEGKAGLATDYEDAEVSADGIADATGKTADNVKKIKAGLRAFDELKTINLPTDNDSGSGGSGGSGDAGGSASGDGGQWTQVDSIFKNYESSLDNLFKLGEYIGTTLTNALTGIDWDKVYQGAKNFGSGLASFLNGLISPDLFGAVGSTIAGALNTAISAALSFGKNFDFKEFGESIATAINNFFIDFNWKQAGEAINTWVNGLADSLRSFLKTLSWKDIISGIGDFLGELELDTVLIVGGAFAFKWAAGVGASAILAAIGTALATTVGGTFTVGTGLALSMGILAVATFALSPVLDDLEITSGLLKSAEDAFENAKKALKNGKFDVMLSEAFNGILANVSAALSFPVEPLLKVFSSSIDRLKKWWSKNANLPNIKSPMIDDIVREVSAGWDRVINWWKNDRPSLGKITTSVESIKNKVSDAWSTATKWWDKKSALSKISPSIDNLKSRLKSAWKTAKEWWKNNVKLKIPKLDFKVTYKEPDGVIQKAVVKALSLKGWPSLQFFATGGFPEDGTFRASHGEIMGRFDNGQSVVANNKQITTGISDAVYRGNQENNSLLREELQLMRTQNDLLRALLEKETGISSRDIFNSVRQSAYEYNRRTGNSAFV